MSRSRGRTQACTAADAAARLRHADLYLRVAELALGDEGPEEATVATGNAVLAGIAAADAICCAKAGARFRGADHRASVEHLGAVTGDPKLAGLLRELVDLKDAGHYGLSDVGRARATRALRRAGQLVDAARLLVRAGT